VSQVFAILYLGVANQYTVGGWPNPNYHHVPERSPAPEWRFCEAKLLNVTTRGGEAMSVYEVVTIVFLAMMFVVALVKLMIYISDKFSKRK